MLYTQKDSQTLCGKLDKLADIRRFVNDIRLETIFSAGIRRAVMDIVTVIKKYKLFIFQLDRKSHV